MLPGAVVHTAGVLLVAAQLNPALHTHALFTHSSPGLHAYALPHPPQLSGSMMVSTHVEPHITELPGHPHLLLEHS